MKRLLAVTLLLALAGLLAYATALDNPLLFDDEQLIGGNANLTWSRLAALTIGDYFSLFPGQWVSYRPMNTLTYILNRSLWGEQYSSWRLFYLALHVANASLFFLFLTRVSLAPATAAISAAFFLLHPLHSEVLNVVSFSEEVVMTFFLLIAWLAFVEGEVRGPRWSLPALVSGYVLGMLTKEPALFFPGVMAAWVLAAIRAAMASACAWAFLALRKALWVYSPGSASRRAGCSSSCCSTSESSRGLPCGISSTTSSPVYECGAGKWIAKP